MCGAWALVAMAAVAASNLSEMAREASLSEDHKVLVYCDEAGVCLKRIDGGERVVLWNAAKRGPGSANAFHSVAISPDGVYVAFIEHLAKESTEGVAAGSLLQVVSASGEHVVTIRDAYEVVWSPDSRHVAYVTGDPFEGDLPCLSNGTWFYDVSTGERKQVFNGGNTLRWQKSDGCLYIWDGQRSHEGSPEVLRFDPSTNELDGTDYRSHELSPDGKRYFVPGIPGMNGEGPFSLYTVEREGSVLIYHVPCLSAELRLKVTPLRWLSDNLLLAQPSMHVKGESRRHRLLLDLRTGEVRELPAQKVLAFSREKDALALLEPPDTVVWIPVGDLTRVSVSGLADHG